MAPSLQHRQATQFIGLSSACTGKHRSDGPKANNALTFKPDYSMGARQMAWLGPPETPANDCHRLVTFCRQLLHGELYGPAVEHASNV